MGPLRRGGRHRAAHGSDVACARPLRTGPVANPNTYNDVPSVATTDPTANFSEICLVAVLNIELANAAVMVVKPNMAAVKIFFLTAQFWACKGSSGPSNSTT